MPADVDLPMDLRKLLDELLAALARDLHGPPLRIGISRERAARIVGGALEVPLTYVEHWSRFHVLPRALIRDAAYEAKRRHAALAGKPGSTVEADSMAYAEAFLRHWDETRE